MHRTFCSLALKPLTLSGTFVVHLYNLSIRSYYTCLEAYTSSPSGQRVPKICSQARSPPFAYARYSIWCSFVRRSNEAVCKMYINRIICACKRRIYGILSEVFRWNSNTICMRLITMAFIRCVELAPVTLFWIHSWVFILNRFRWTTSGTESADATTPHAHFIAQSGIQ